MCVLLSYSNMFGGIDLSLKRAKVMKLGIVHLGSSKDSRFTTSLSGEEYIPLDLAEQ